MEAICGEHAIYGEPTWLQHATRASTCTRPEFTARIRWEKGTVTIWDNRCCQHFAINDYHGQRRVMWRLPVGAEAVA